MSTGSVTSDTSNTPFAYQDLPQSISLTGLTFDKRNGVSLAQSSQPSDITPVPESPFNIDTIYVPPSEQLQPYLDWYRQNLLPGESEVTASDVISELENIGKRFGFDVVTLKDTSTPNPWIWIEDPGFLYRNKSGELTFVTSNIEFSEFSRANDFSPSAAKNTGLLGGSIGAIPEAIDYWKSQGANIRVVDTFVDGGNVLFYKNRQGNSSALIGKGSLYVNALLFDSKGFFDEAEVNRIANSTTWTQDQIKEGSELAKHALKLKSEKNPRAQESATQWLARLELTKRKIAEDLQLDSAAITYIEQSAFHIDMENRFISSDTVMVNDVNETIKTLESLIADPAVPAQERELLQKILDQHKQDLPQYQQVQEAKIKTLQDAGLKVVRAPLSFDFYAGFDKAENYSGNFANGIAGKSDTGEAFFITATSGISSLDKTFKSFMQKLGISVEYLDSRLLLYAAGSFDCITLHKRTTK